MAEHANEQDEQYEGFDETEAEEQKQKPAYSKIIVALCLVEIMAYTVTCFFFIWNGKPINDTLTRLFFACFGFEFGALAYIKGREIRYVAGNAASGIMPHVKLRGDDDERD